MDERLMERPLLDRDPLRNPESHRREEGRLSRTSFARVEAHRRFVCWGPLNAGMKRFVTTAAQRGGWSRFHPLADDLPEQWDSHRQLEYACLDLAGTRLSLCAVPDKVRGSALARGALRDADGVLIFVPTSVDRIEDTIRSQELLEDTLRELGRQPEDTARVWVWSRSLDAGEHLTIEELESMFNPHGQPSFLLDPESGYADSVRGACADLARSRQPGH